MKKYVYMLMAAFAMMQAVTSCRDLETDILNPDMSDSYYITRTYEEQFKRVWQGIDVGYCFWQWDNVDWDSVYNANLPIFQEADKNVKDSIDTLSADEYKKIWSSIVQPLADHHMLVAVRDPYTENLAVMEPSRLRRSSDDYHPSFTRQQHLSTIKNMLASGELNAELTVDSVYDAFGGKQYIVSGMINDNIAYLYLSSFMVSKNDSAMKAHVARLRENLAQGTKAGTLKGMILDTRNNGGGYAYWGDVIGAWFTQKEVTVCYQYMKKDVGRYDYAPPTPYTIKPDSALFMREMSDDCPIVCLFDQNSVSNGEEIPWTLSKMPGYASVGERTCGGMGGLMMNTYTPFFSGTFGNADIGSGTGKGNYYCYLSLFAHVDADTGQCPEGIGMIPQIEERLDTAAFFKGQRDNQLLRAIKRVETGK